MKNRDILAAWKYHDGTKHSYWSIRNNPHYLDWANRPLPFKIYPKIESFPLPRDVSQTGVAALSAVSQPVPSSPADSMPDLQDLARILYYSAGITKQRAYPGGEIYFRAAAYRPRTPYCWMKSASAFQAICGCRRTRSTNRFTGS
jgi:hypothetical protein